MANQKRMLEWQDDDATDLINRQHLGILQYGVYQGFNVVSHPNTTHVRIDHSSPQISTTEHADGSTIVENVGLVLTKQGVVVLEEAGSPYLDIYVPPQPSGIRRDTLVVDHDKTQVAGVGGIAHGTQALYRIITGTVGSTTEPSANSFPTYTPIGYFICDNTTDANGITFVRYDTPINLNIENVLINNIRSFAATQSLGFVQLTGSVDSINRLQLTNVGNNFQVTLNGSAFTDKEILGFVSPYHFPSGTEINIKFYYGTWSGDKCRLYAKRGNAPQTAPSTNYININAFNTNSNSPLVQFVEIEDGASITVYKSASDWEIKSITQAISSSVGNAFPVLQLVNSDYYVPVSLSVTGNWNTSIMNAVPTADGGMVLYGNISKTSIAAITNDVIFQLPNTQDLVKGSGFFKFIPQRDVYITAYKSTSSGVETSPHNSAGALRLKIAGNTAANISAGIVGKVFNLGCLTNISDGSGTYDIPHNGSPDQNIDYTIYVEIPALNLV